MISALGIHDLGVISRAQIELGPGLTVVTGETGAGKTMFVTALDLLTGARADSQMVRKGADRAVVEGVFELTDGPAGVRARIEEAGGEAEEDAIVSRILPTSGRARATAGGRTVPLGVLREIGDELVSMHGQSEQLGLKSPSKQRALLDEYAGAPVAKALRTYREAFAHWKELRAEHARLLETSRERAERVAFLATSLEKIDAVRPLPGEDTELAALAQRLRAAEDLKTAVGTAHTALVGADWEEAPNAADLVGAAVHELQRAAVDDAGLEDRAAALTELTGRISDLASDLSAYLQGFDDLDAVSLEETENRRAEIGSLSVYGEDVTEVLAFEERAGAELTQLQNAESSLEDIDERVGAAHARVLDTGAALMEARRKAAKRFATAVSTELTALSMPRARIVFEIEEAGDGPHTWGTDSVRMLFSAHDAGEPGDIGRLASGGELSRVMLAIEVVKARTESFPTFVFDEVDSGVGGKAAIEIGRRLAILAQGSQVIVVTHLPQVAAWADHHLTIVKDDRAKGAVSGVDVLDRAGRETELARMLGGMADSESARTHAAELMETAEHDKARF
ncbi:DNA repair protein RecN [Brevibacterium litoralis]|uniref:DNA repair protein RecN n=1 Tax=Brevibacterium litoralis TaxID=3138935 RepID=UPI0032ECF638